MRAHHLVVLMTIGCSEYEVKQKDDGNLAGIDEGAPDIEVSPASIDFGMLSVAEGATSTQTVTVTNIGDQTLELQNVSLEDNSAPYDIGAVGSMVVPPGEATNFTVTFAPVTANEATGRVQVLSNDPDEAVAYVDLLGEGQAPAIELTPVSYDFGAPNVGCEQLLTVEVRNVGNQELIIDGTEFVSASPEFSYDADTVINGEYPWTLQPDDFLEVKVGYLAWDDTIDQAYLKVYSNDPYQETAQAQQFGTGDEGNKKTDEFDQPLNGAADILFVVDNSSSMTAEQASLNANFSVFATGLDELDVDFHIALITVEDPEFVGAVITPDSGDVAGEFIDQSTMPIISGVSEQPSEMAYQATQVGGDAGPGGEFLRDEAKLSIIFISDEVDESRASWETYLAHFQSLKADASDFVAHAISGNYPGGCADASATNKVYEMTVETGGLYLSICSEDWAAHLDALVEGSTYNLAEFDLSEDPVPETIQVTVDGVAVTTGWYYDEEENAVVFYETDVPEGGSHIEVTYAIAGSCDQ
jgi:hypothetical protein